MGSCARYAALHIRHDRDGALVMMGLDFGNLLNVKTVLCDGGYIGENFAHWTREIIGAEVEVVKRNELHKFAVLPKRWILDRTFGWFEDYRLLRKNCERKLHSMLQAVKFTPIALILRRY